LRQVSRVDKITSWSWAYFRDQTIAHRGKSS
jgi:hypothetical protein